MKIDRASVISGIRTGSNVRPALAELLSDVIIMIIITIIIVVVIVIIVIIRYY